MTGSDSNLTFVENHYPAPSAVAQPSAPSLDAIDGLASPSSPMQVDVG